jgi:hypothetical protein
MSFDPYIDEDSGPKTPKGEHLSLFDLFTIITRRQRLYADLKPLEGMVLRFNFDWERAEQWLNTMQQAYEKRDLFIEEPATANPDEDTEDHWLRRLGFKTHATTVAKSKRKLLVWRRAYQPAL